MFLPKFDPLLGTLTSVELSLEGGGEISGEAFNPDPFSIGAILLDGFIGVDVAGFFAAEFGGSGLVEFLATGDIAPNPPFADLAPFEIMLSGSGGTVITDGASLSDFTATFPGEDHPFDLFAGPPEVFGSAQSGGGGVRGALIVS